MPIVDVQRLSGRITDKKAHTKAVADVTVKELDVPEEAIRMILTEIAPSDVER